MVAREVPSRGSQRGLKLDKLLKNDQNYDFFAVIAASCFIVIGGVNLL